MRDRRGLKPLSAHGLRVQTEKWRSRRGNRAKERREKESGEPVSSSCPSESDNDGALLPCNPAGKFTTLAELICIINFLHVGNCKHV